MVGPKSLTTFSNAFGSWTWDSEAQKALRMDTGHYITSLAEFIRYVNGQRSVHIRLGLPYSVAQEIVPAGGASNADDSH